MTMSNFLASHVDKFLSSAFSVFRWKLHSEVNKGKLLKARFLVLKAHPINLQSFCLIWYFDSLKCTFANYFLS